MASSYTSSPRHFVEQEYDDNDIYDFNDDFCTDDLEGDEDTDDASEAEMERKEEYTEMKEQSDFESDLELSVALCYRVYIEKLEIFRNQQEQLAQGTLPEYVKKVKKIDQTYVERVTSSEIWAASQKEQIEKDYIKEKKAAAKEFEAKKTQLKENLLQELTDKKKYIEQEKNSIDLNGAYFMDVTEYKPASTRKLRRRANDPVPTCVEKRRKASPDLLSSMTFVLTDDHITEDLKIINKVSGKPLPKKVYPTPPTTAAAHDNLYEARIDDGRLYYEKKWYSRNQPVYLDMKDSTRTPFVITSIGISEVWLRKTTDTTKESSKLRITIAQLQRGKYMIRKRT